ncbi:uncharacterized protein V1510DRAFT_416908 [Dipodascopsis tothii]|uniref:uncharacterized protein n=1 Tax=Dipodascopsis tothii TaxID=44089 RepID=UPI0034CF31C3
MSGSEDGTNEQFNQLAKLETDFEQAELDVLKYQTKTLKPLYARRAKIINALPRFWPIALEQFGEDIDQYITPQDAKLFEAIAGVDLERDEADPRTFTLTFTFDDNEYLDQKVLAKTFRYVAEEAADGEDGPRHKYVSDAVEIQWKPKKNLAKTKVGAPTSFFTWFAWQNAGGDHEDVFEDAHELALALAEDLYPNAVKYYIEAIDEENESDDEIDIGSDGSDGSDGSSDAETPPKKKQRS